MNKLEVQGRKLMLTALLGHWALVTSGANLISPEIFHIFRKDFQRFSRALPLVSNSLRSLQASFAALSSEEGDLPEKKGFIRGHFCK